MSSDKKMKLFSYSGSIGGYEHVAGIVVAETKQKAVESLRGTYKDYGQWRERDVEEVKLEPDGVCEIYYGS